MATQTVTGVFSNGDAAFEAAEQAREIAGARATIRVLLRGKGASIIETAVVTYTRGWTTVALSGTVLGLVSMGLFRLLGATGGLSLVALLYGVGAGLLLGLWLTGEVFRPRLLQKQEVRLPYEKLVAAGKAVVTVVVTDTNHGVSVRNLFASLGAEVYDGFLHDRRYAPETGPAPQPV